MEPHELPPQWWEKLLYLGGFRRAPEGPDREWLRHVLATTPPRKLGFLVMLPQALFLFAFGLFDFLILEDNTLGWILCIGSLVNLVLSTFLPWLRNIRLRQLERKNSFP